MADKVVIRIAGDDSEFQNELKKTERSVRSAASALGAEYKKAGMTQSEAMKKAWAECQQAQKNGTSVMINGVETLIRANEQLENSVPGDIYAPVDDSAKQAIETAEKLQNELQDIRRRIPDVPYGIYDPIADSAESAADKVTSAMDRIKRGTATAISGLGKISGPASNVFGGLKKIGPTALTAFKGIAIGVGAIGTAIAGVGTATVKYTSNVEQLQTSFEVMTGSAQKAEQVMDRISQLGADTPFEMTDLAETTQLLMNYGFAADNAINRMTMLGDIAQGNADKMNSIATAYGQMSSAGKVSLEDVKQMIDFCHAA